MDIGAILAANESSHFIARLFKILIMSNNAVRLSKSVTIVQ